MSNSSFARINQFDEGPPVLPNFPATKNRKGKEKMPLLEVPSLTNEHFDEERSNIPNFSAKKVKKVKEKEMPSLHKEHDFTCSSPGLNEN